MARTSSATADMVAFPSCTQHAGSANANQLLSCGAAMSFDHRVLEATADPTLVRPTWPWMVGRGVAERREGWGLAHCRRRLRAAGHGSPVWTLDAASCVGDALRHHCDRAVKVRLGQLRSACHPQGHYATDGCISYPLTERTEYPVNSDRCITFAHAVTASWPPGESEFDVDAFAKWLLHKREAWREPPRFDR